MNLTFFIGNGFDISHGLKTTYRDFLKWYLSFDSSDSEINDFKRNTIEKDLETWADAEIAFGKVTGRYTAETIPILQKCIDDFIRELSKYLKEQARALDIDFNNTAKSITAIITKLSNLLRPESKQQMDGLLLSYSNENRVYNFISFNYTDLLDKSIETLGIEKQDFATHKGSNGNTYKDIVGKVMHVHGTTELEMVFGVDNELQIVNEEFRNNNIIKKSLIKPEINRRLKTGIARDVKGIVDSSNIIVIYGMSLGATDATWWKYITEWLRNNRHRQLILFTHQSGYDPTLARSFMDVEDNIEDRFFSYSSLDENTKDELKNRIHIVINKDLLPVKFRSEEDKIRQAYKEKLLKESELNHISY